MKCVWVHNRIANSPAFRRFCLLQDYNMDLHNSILEALTPIKQTFKKSKRLSKTLLEAATCFMCLAFEARPSFLYDQGRISVETALQVAQNLSSVSDAFHDIVVLEYAQDILFAKLGLLLPSRRTTRYSTYSCSRTRTGSCCTWSAATVRQYCAFTTRRQCQFARAGQTSEAVWTWTDHTCLKMAIMRVARHMPSM